MSNMGQAEFDYDTFKQSYDSDPALQSIVHRFDQNGVELKSKVSGSNVAPSDADLDSKSVNKMAKAATARRQG